MSEVLQLTAKDLMKAYGYTYSYAINKITRIKKELKIPSERKVLISEYCQHYKIDPEEFKNHLKKI
jgi:hypothetical protein